MTSENRIKTSPIAVQRLVTSRARSKLMFHPSCLQPPFSRTSSGRHRKGRKISYVRSSPLLCVFESIDHRPLCMFAMFCISLENFVGLPWVSLSLVTTSLVRISPRPREYLSGVDAGTRNNCFPQFHYGKI